MEKLCGSTGIVSDISSADSRIGTKMRFKGIQIDMLADKNLSNGIMKIIRIDC